MFKFVIRSVKDLFAVRVVWDGQCDGAVHSGTLVRETLRKGLETCVADSYMIGERAQYVSQYLKADALYLGLVLFVCCEAIHIEQVEGISGRTLVYVHDVLSLSPCKDTVQCVCPCIKLVDV